METARSPQRRLVRSPVSRFKPGQTVRVDCDFISDAIGIVTMTTGRLSGVGVSPDYQAKVAPGVHIRVTKDTGDWTIGDDLQAFDDQCTLVK